MPSYDYRCEGCGFEDFELRKPEEKNDPLVCPQCSGAMTFFIGKDTMGYLRIVDTKMWEGEKPGTLEKKSRTRVISQGVQTEIGRVIPSKLTKEAIAAAAKKGE